MDLCPDLSAQADRYSDSGWSIPVVFALLPDKARTTYNRMFDAIKVIQPNLAPDAMMVDLELALHRSIRNAFPPKY